MEQPLGVGDVYTYILMSVRTGSARRELYKIYMPGALRDRTGKSIDRGLIILRCTDTHWTTGTGGATIRRLFVLTSGIEKKNVHLQSRIGTLQRNDNILLEIFIYLRKNHSTPSRFKFYMIILYT